MHKPQELDSILVGIQQNIWNREINLIDKNIWRTKVMKKI